MGKIQFSSNDGSFTMKQPENYSDLYFPIAGEKGIKSSVTPDLGGDSKINQETFLLEPVSVENLHNNRGSRNFWCDVEGVGLWSATGASAEAEMVKFTSEQDDSQLQAGLMWHTVNRQSKKYQLSAKVTSFVPLEYNVELMHVEIINTAKQSCTLTPVAAIPVYGRSADNIRDHRHVTSLLHRIETQKNGVTVKPTMSFDERGHRKNHLTYFVLGVSGQGKAPVAFYPTVEQFVGEGGTYTHPRALLEHEAGAEAGVQFEGKEAFGGICFEKITLQPKEKADYLVIIGVTEQVKQIKEIVQAYDSTQKVENALQAVQKY